MTEKVLTNKKNGMAVLILTIALYGLAFLATVGGAFLLEYVYLWVNTSVSRCTL